MPAASPFTHIDDGLKAHIESGVAIVVGTRDARLSPEITRGWGPRILPDRTSIQLWISRSTGARTLENLRENGEIAATFCLPTDYKAIQLKGHVVGYGEELTAADRGWVVRHRDAFAEQTELVGVPKYLVSRTFSDDLVRVEFVVREGFNQTPGPGAGATL